MYLVIISLFMCHLNILYQFFTNPLMAMFPNNIYLLFIWSKTKSLNNIDIVTHYNSSYIYVDAIWIWDTTTTTQLVVSHKVNVTDPNIPWEHLILW